MPLRSIHTTAPIRICDNGGWTDTWFARHGKVFNIAVRPRVHVEVDVYARGSRESSVVLDIRNYGMRYAPDLDSQTWGPHPLLEAAFREIPPPRERDIEIRIHSKAPAGASTGTSAAVLVALLGALDRLSGGSRDPHAIARAAHAVETLHLRRQCGIQDQLASAFGGVNFIEMTEYPHATVTPLALPDPLRYELQRRLVVIFLGRSHSSSDVHEMVVRRLECQGPDNPELNTLRVAAVRARDALLAEDLNALGAAMRDNTEAQAALHPDLVHDDVRSIIGIARAHGASGWKVNGAGGDGGTLTLLGPPGRFARHAMVRAIIDANPTLVVMPVVISRRGLTVEATYA